MASLLPLRLICGSMFLLFTVLGTSLSYPLSPLDEMKMYWAQNHCVFPSRPLYFQETFSLQQETNPVHHPVLQSCENPNRGFHQTLCSTFFNVSKSLCGINDVSLKEHLQHDVLATSVDNVTWDVCYYARSIGMPSLFGFITQDPAVCKSQCEKNPQTAPVCKWLIAAVVSYTEVQLQAKAEADRARKEGGTAGQQQSDQAKVDETRKDDSASASGKSGVPNGTVSQEAAQTTHMIPENDSDGARANKPNGSGTEPPTREETPPLTNVSDAKNASEQKTIPENVLTNNSIVTKIPLSVRSTQHPKYADKSEGDLTLGLQTGKPKPPLENIPQPSSITPSTPLNSKWGVLQGNGGKEGGTAGQQQSDQAEVDETRKDDSALASGKSGVPNGTVSQEAAQTTHMIPENDSEGARANKPNGSGTEPPTREEKPPLTNVSDAKNTNKQKTIPENVLTNDSNVTKIPLSVRTTQHPRYADKSEGDLTLGLQTGKPKPQLKNSPQPSSTTPSTPLNSKSEEPHGKGDEEQSREQDQEESGHKIKNYNDTPPQGDGGRLSSSDVYHGLEDGSDDEEPPSGHFMAYFITAVVLCVAGYVIYHNKKKIFAFVLEGRREGQQRRRSSAGSSSGGSSAKYHKLTPSVEEVMPSLEKSTSSTNYIY